MYITIAKNSKISGWRTPITGLQVRIGAVTTVSDFEGQEAKRQRGFICECDKDGNILTAAQVANKVAPTQPEVQLEPPPETTPTVAKDVIDADTVTRRRGRKAAK